MDGPEGETLVEKALHKEAVKAILSGAVVFFPDKNVRRDKLFNMMVSLFREIFDTLIKTYYLAEIIIFLFVEKYYRRG